MKQRIVHIVVLLCLPLGAMASQPIFGPESHEISMEQTILPIEEGKAENLFAAAKIPDERFKTKDEFDVIRLPRALHKGVWLKIRFIYQGDRQKRMYFANTFAYKSLQMGFETSKGRFELMEPLAVDDSQLAFFSFLVKPGENVLTGRLHGVASHNMHPFILSEDR